MNIRRVEDALKERKRTYLKDLFPIYWTVDRKK